MRPVLVLSVVVMDDRSLTVVQLVPSLEGGGVERGTLEVAGELTRRGHRSIVVSGGGRLVDTLVREGSEHLELPVGAKSPAALTSLWRLRQLVISQRVDLLHARSRVPAWLAWLTLRSLPARQRPVFVTTVHGLYSVSRFSKIMTAGDAVIAVSRTIKDYIETHYPATPAARVHLIPRGIDPAVYPHGFRPSPEWGASIQAAWTPASLSAESSSADQSCERRPWLTLPGRLTRLKGHLDFVRLIRRLLDAGRAVQGLIVGGVDPRRQAYSAEVVELIRSLHLESHVTLTGHRSDLREILAASAVVFSLSTQPESFGRTTLEALALGRPVVGYDHGGVGELLHELYPSGTVPVGDEQALFDRTRALLDAPQAVRPFSGYRLQDSLQAEVDLYQQLVIRRHASVPANLPCRPAATANFEPPHSTSIQERAA